MHDRKNTSRCGWLQSIGALCLLMAWSHVQAMTTPSNKIELDEIERIAANGAVHLSLAILEREQVKWQDQHETWLVWERKRLALYRELKQWQKLVQRIEKIPSWVDIEFQLFARTEKVRALLQLQQGTLAREELRRLIWQSKPEVLTGEQIVLWQKLIIDSFLLEGLTRDAQLANTRLQLVQPQQDKAAIIQRARIAILSKQMNDAVSLLKPLAAEADVAALLLFAQLHAEVLSATEVKQRAMRYLQDEKTPTEIHADLWALVATAAKQNGERDETIQAQENVLLDKSRLSLDKTVYTINTDDVWNAYLDYAVHLANQSQLLIGQDVKWIELSQKMAQEKQSIAARALQAFIMLRGQIDQDREQAAQLFVESIVAHTQGQLLLLALFRDSGYFKTTRAIPAPARRLLVDIALKNAQIDRASELMATIEAPPAGEDQFMWRLRRARILVLGNQAKIGATAVLSLLKTQTPLTQDQIDKLLQVVFDLQTAGEHEAAYRCFIEALKFISDEQIQRELFYWMADSRKAQERYAEAAELYLKSAMHPDPKRMDPWAQTAFYQAAESLARGGLYKDAEVLFKRLLKITEDPARRATLKRELQRLWAAQ